MDREAYANTVFLGAAVPVHGPVTPGNKDWFWPDIPRYRFDRAAAQGLLEGLGLANRDADAFLEDAAGHRGALHPAHLPGQLRARTRRAGAEGELRADRRGHRHRALEPGALVERMLAGEFDAIFFNSLSTDTDPAMQRDFWLSSGSAHVWNIGQKTPATDWERRIDELMTRQAAARRSQRAHDALPRRAADLQRAAAGALLRRAAAVRRWSAARVRNVTPAITRPQLLWSADTTGGGPAGRDPVARMSLARFVARRAAGAVVFALVVASLTMALARLAPGDADAIDRHPPDRARRAARRAGPRPARGTCSTAGGSSGLRRLDLGRSSLYGRPVADLVGERARQHRAPGLGGAGRSPRSIGLPLGPLHRRRAVVAGPGGAGRVAVAAVGAAAHRLAAAGAGGGADRMGAGRRHAVGGSRRRRVVRRAAAAPAGAGAGAGAAAGRHARALAGAIDGRGGGPARSCGPAWPAGARCRDALRLHAWPVSLTPVLGVYGVLVAALFSGSFVVETITAWPGLGRLLDGRPARPRRLAGGRLRRRRRGAARGGDAGGRRRPLGDRSARCSGVRRDAAGAAAAHRGRSPASCSSRRGWRRTTRPSDSPSIRTPRRCARISTPAACYFVPLQAHRPARPSSSRKSAGARVPGPWQAGPAGVPARRRRPRPRRVLAHAARRARRRWGSRCVATLGHAARRRAARGVGGPRRRAGRTRQSGRSATSCSCCRCCTRSSRCGRRCRWSCRWAPSWRRWRSSSSRSAGRGSPAASGRSCASRRSRNMCWPPRRSAPRAGGC